MSSLCRTVSKNDACGSLAVEVRGKQETRDNRELLVEKLDNVSERGSSYL